MLLSLAATTKQRASSLFFICILHVNPLPFWLQSKQSPEEKCMKIAASLSLSSSSIEWSGMNEAAERFSTMSMRDVDRNRKTEKIFSAAFNFRDFQLQEQQEKRSMWGRQEFFSTTYLLSALLFVRRSAATRTIYVLTVVSKLDFQSNQERAERRETREHKFLHTK